MVIIYGNEVEVSVGSVIKIDGWRFAEKLIPSSWEPAQFYIPTSSGGPIKQLAVNVTITGRTWQRREGEYWVRVKIEFVGDGEPSEYTSGWMLKKW